MIRIVTGATMLLLLACGHGGATDAVSAEVPLAGATSLRPGEMSVSRRFRDWSAVCDNGNGCVAYTGGIAAWIRVGMEAGPGAEPTIRLGMWPDGGGALAGPLYLVIDGRRHVTTPGPEDTSSALVPQVDVRAIIAELTAARTISLAAGDQDANLPAGGVSASLLWFDERQGRLDTVTALVRRGGRPASTVPLAPALPFVTVAPAVSQAGFETSLMPMNSDEDRPNAVPSAALEADPGVRQCRENTAFNDYLGKAVTASRLDASTELWGIPCDSGAYNVSYLYFLTGPGGIDAREVRFPDKDGRPIEGADGAAEWLVNPAYDPATRTLTALAKGRGPGDCGVFQTWTWTGRSFALSGEQVMSDCFGMVLDFWPTTFRSR